MMVVKSHADYALALAGFRRMQTANPEIQIREHERGQHREAVAGLVTTKAYATELARSWLLLVLGDNLELRVTPSENGANARVIISLHVRTETRHLRLIEEDGQPHGA